MSRDVKVLGTTDDCTTCECCGRENLKSTVVLSIDGGDPVHYGCDCAAREIGRSAAEIRKAARRANSAREDQELVARRAAANAELAPWLAFLASRGTGSDNFSRIESLGGYAIARALYHSEVTQ